MKKLLYKEFKLSLNPLYFIFVLMGAMIMIPEYNYYVIFIYTAMVVVNNIFTTGKANKDIEYTAMLPIGKRDVVKARFLSVVLYQLVNIAVTAIFAVIANAVYGNGANLGGIDRNVAFFGFVLVMMGVFNISYMPAFYKTANKILRPVVFGMIALVVCIGVFETVSQYVYSPVSMYLDASTAQGNFMQIPVLVCGIIIYAVLNILAYRISAKRFERIDL